MRRQLRPALRMLVVLTALCGLAYPLLVTGLAQAAFGNQANGSLLTDDDGTVVGSSLIGQAFEGDEWFHPRPSSAGDGYDATSSSSSNLGPNERELLTSVRQRVEAYRLTNGLTGDAEVPVDAVTGSGSGLDPHISVANARLQAPRVADARNLAVDEVLALVADHTEARPLGFLGEPGVNVVALNLDLDQQS